MHTRVINQAAEVGRASGLDGGHSKKAEGQAEQLRRRKHSRKNRTHRRQLVPEAGGVPNVGAVATGQGGQWMVQGGELTTCQEARSVTRWWEAGWLWRAILEDALTTWQGN